MLLSGGIDSPVAAYRAMKRGLRCDYVHFSGRPYTGPESIYKSYAHVAALDRFQGGSRLFIVPFGVAQRRIAAAGAGRLQLLTQRRLMMKVASELARREGGEALVTGDSLGQVSSQTLHNMGVVERAADLPVLRPLVAWDKAEIVREAKEIGTYAVSALPAEDCCTLFASPLAETRAAPEKAEHARGQARPGGDRRGARRGRGARAAAPGAPDHRRFCCSQADFTPGLHWEYPELIRGNDHGDRMSARRRRVRACPDDARLRRDARRRADGDRPAHWRRRARLPRPPVTWRRPTSPTP